MNYLRVYSLWIKRQVLIWQETDILKLLILKCIEYQENEIKIKLIIYSIFQRLLLINELKNKVKKYK